MNRYHTTAEGDIPFTAEEEAERDIEEVKILAEKPKVILRTQIAALEAKITERMKREAVLSRTTVNSKTGKTAKQEIEDIDNQIEVLRAQLNV